MFNVLFMCHILIYIFDCVCIPVCKSSGKFLVYDVSLRWNVKWKWIKLKKKISLPINSHSFIFICHFRANWCRKSKVWRSTWTRVGQCPQVTTIIFFYHIYNLFVAIAAHSLPIHYKVISIYLRYSECDNVDYKMLVVMMSSTIIPLERCMTNLKCSCCTVPQISMIAKNWMFLRQLSSMYLG